jgi:hypothetical protein
VTAPVFRVVDERGHQALATDDWAAAEQAASAGRWPKGGSLRVRGTHPSHQWGPPRPGQATPDRRCTACGGWDNGSYGSHAPCGYDFKGGSLAAAIERELAGRGGEPPC